MIDPKQAFAVIVGIDEYVTNPLTSAVTDALAFRDALIRFGLVDPSNIELFTAPKRPDSALPIKKNISNAMYRFYKTSTGVERLFFYFAGHGVIALTNAGRGRSTTALLCLDVEDLDRDGGQLLDVKELYEHFELRGPREQYFIIDACRDKPYESYVQAGNLGWAGEPLGNKRAQAVLYAVSPLGQAQAETLGQGVMTRYLIDALEGKGLGIQFEEQYNAYIVSIHSIHEHVKTLVGEQVEKISLWSHLYQLPDLDPASGNLEPLRVLDSVPDRPFTIHVEPDAAVPLTEIELLQRTLRLKDHCLPPRRNHAALDLPPDRYRLIAKSGYGEPAPSIDLIDTRRRNEVVVRVTGPPGGGGPKSAIPGGSGPTIHASRDLPSSPPAMKEAFPTPGDRLGRRGRKPLGRFTAKAMEPEVLIELQSLDRPDRSYRQRGALEVNPEPGSYRLQFSLGPYVFSQVELWVGPGDQVEALPNADLSPLVREALGERLGPQDVVISETIGPIQSGIIPTMLAIVGIKALDTENEVFHQFDDRIPLTSPAELNGPPVVVVLGIDGEWQGMDAAERLTKTMVALREHDGASLTPSTRLEKSRSTTLAEVSTVAADGLGLERIGTAVLGAPRPSFATEIEIPKFGRFRIATAAQGGHATVVTVSIRPDGRYELNQLMVPLPVRSRHLDMPLGRIVRDVTVAQRLYRSGDLLKGVKELSLFQALQNGDSPDPLLTAMAMLVNLQASPGIRPSLGTQDRKHIADNLRSRFPDLPDARLVHALVHGQGMGDLVLDGNVPILAEANRLLMEWTHWAGLRHERADSYLRRIPKGEIWSMEFVVDVPTGPSARTKARESVLVH